ncbi:PAS domain S-box protein [Sphingomonas melonis]|uniref:PAS domain S-box-containing protein n=2 Tax=Sphingomonas TaxID=13687 RepID=A0AAW3TMI1_9SPHN|nr:MULTISPECIES: PAS domain S-box protein [Sphingomonas]ANC87342.1 helix-turn-helix transcriptional regulator [Sphingomonas sp. NIC1]MBB3874358.1 PAS domain S-box-containing protein [Sphingomonas aquatilis]MCI4653838.1 PAS domain S-box protein [Sphingomonas aquatilis]GEM72720.1 transcriptional regulator [Sphingomonas aquatilis NBRC 16722]
MTAALLKSLRDTVDLRHLRQIIVGLDEGVILIDPDQSLLWANDAALAMHGVGSVEELGATVDEYRSRFQLRYRNNHRLEADDYPIERVVAGDSFSEVVVEVTVAGEDAPRWVHQVRSLVLNDADDGEPACLVLIIQDVSARYEAEDRFEQSFNANPAPAVICRLSDLRFVKVNQGFLEMTGHQRDQVLCKTVYDIDVLREAERRDLAKERLAEGRTIPQMEAELELPGGGTKLVIVAGQPIDMGDQPCMLFTFADLEPRRKAEGALRHSEERFTRTFQMAPVPMAIGARDGHLLCEVNASFTQMTGYASTEIIGRPLGEVELWEHSTMREEIEALIEDGHALRGHEARIHAKDGAGIDCLVSTEAIRLGDDACVLWAFQDITQRKATELELVEAIEAVMKDTSWFSRSIMDKLARLRAPERQADGPGLDDLTRRERDVLALICRGYDDKRIARALDVSGNTVRNHVARIYAKIGVNRRIAAVAWARARGFDGEGVVIETEAAA